MRLRMSVADRRARFRALHAGSELFVMPNPWDVGSAKLLAACGFQALATTSAGFAWALGKNDQQVTRDELVAHVEAVARDAAAAERRQRAPVPGRPGRHRRDGRTPRRGRRRRLLDRGLQ